VGACQPAGIPLAVVGGPLVEDDYWLFDLAERAGGRVVLDGTEGGERTLPAPFDHRRMAEDPLEELANAYFLNIPDVFRRPNDALYDWLGQHLAARNVRGILFRRYVWCDLWHGEFHRLKAWSPVPVLEIDVNHFDRGAAGRATARVEAFLEMLR
jgi:benzoyl-CoA reductase/2-hydroxyglutaryl-CoA dehydratase subunit BcrC/BadD/HgdB